MRYNEYKIALILLALLLTLGVLLGGQKLYNANLIEKPLVNELSALSCVESASVDKVEDIYQIEVRIRQAGDLQNEYQEIDKIIAARVNGRPYKIAFSDKRDQFLHNQLQQMQLAIYEAIAHSTYLDLQQRFADAAARDHFAYRLQIDRQQLYVQMSRDDNFLYEIIAWGDTDKVSGDKGE